MFANVERERERDWCRHIKVNIPSADQQVEREREREREIERGRERERERERDVCVFVLNFVIFFYSGNSSAYFKVCVDLCKNLIVRDV